MSFILRTLLWRINDDDDDVAIVTAAHRDVDSGCCDAIQADCPLARMAQTL